MSNKDDITQIGNELSEYRENAQQVVRSNLRLYAKILLRLNSVKDDKVEIKEFKSTLSNEFGVEIKSCLDSIEKYNDSLINDYGNAIKKLTKLKEEL
ncbi:hypothetical protein [Proteus sp. TJ1640]|uniref:hypothetical protein n=1 Tax=Proteus sp. TJ1640 TaxID=2050968 RepID=UPI000D6A0566|nr:hypothetical protein [Proteus sp. TJ1640]